MLVVIHSFKGSLSHIDIKVLKVILFFFKQISMYSLWKVIYAFVVILVPQGTFHESTIIPPIIPTSEYFLVVISRVDDLVTPTVRAIKDCARFIWEQNLLRSNRLCYLLPILDTFLCVLCPWRHGHRSH